MGCIRKKGHNRGMEKTDLKSRIMADMEVEVDEIVDWEVAKAAMTLEDIEDILLIVRQRMSEKIAQHLMEERERKRAGAIPESRVTGKRLHPKGKKREA